MDRAGSSEFDGRLPDFLKKVTWDGRSEAAAGIARCGTAGGERLRAVFADPKHQAPRSEVIGLWGEMG